MFPRLVLNLGLLTSTSLDTGMTGVCHQTQCSSINPSDLSQSNDVRSCMWRKFLSVALEGVEVLSLGLKATVSVL